MPEEEGKGLSDKSPAVQDERKIQAEPILAKVDSGLELDPELELNLRDDEDYTPDNPVSKSGMQYTKKFDRVDRMGTDKLGKLIAEFAIPSIVSMMVNGSYNVVDSIFLGASLGALGQATVAVASPIMILSMAFSVLVGAGGNALAAIKLGEGKRETAERVLGNSLTLFLVLAALASASAFIFMDQLLIFSGSTETVHESARAFVSIIAGGMIFQFLGMGFNNFMRTAGNPRGALYTMVTGIAVATALNYLLVIVLGWGVVGSAVATVAGQVVSCVIVLNYFIRSKNVPFKLRLRYMAPSPRLMANILVLGSSSFLMQIAGVIVNLIINNELNYYGALDPIGADGALAAIGGVASRIVMFSFFPLGGISVGIQPILGYNYGARQFDRVKDTFKIGLFWMMCIGTLFFVIVHVFPAQIVQIFNVSEDLHVFTTKAIQIMMFWAPVLGLQMLTTTYFQATGQPVKSIFLGITRQLLYMIPLLIALPIIVPMLPIGMTALEGVYLAYPVSDIFSLITCAIMMMLEWKQLNRRMKEKTEDNLTEAAQTV